MKHLEAAVARHYGDPELLERILAGLKAAGADMHRLRTEDLAPVDEFHLGGRKATAFAVEKMGLTPHHHVLDIGCGIGGASRYIAEQVGCRVSGIDVTPEYIATAQALTDLTGLTSRVSHEVASALDMPFGKETFDAAVTIHVAMNIQDRATLYGEMARVLKPGATACIYDVMKIGTAPLTFPVPWAESQDTSYLATPEEMDALLDGAGFTVRNVEDRTQFVLEVFRQRPASATDGPPPLGIHLILGASAPVMFKNTLLNIESGRAAPVQMIATRNSA